MKFFTGLLVLLSCSFSWAGSSQDLYSAFERLGLATPVGTNGDQVVSLQLLSCAYSTATGTKDYACWYQLRSTTGTPNDAQLIADHSVGKAIYLALRAAGYSERQSNTVGEIFVHPFSCKKAISAQGAASYSCAQSN